MNDDLVLCTRGLTKDFGRLRAVDHLDLEVRRGDVFAFLGPNGAGKSTTIRMIMGLIRSDEGQIEVLGHNTRREREAAMRKVGAIVEEPAFYRFLSGRRNLELLSAMSGGAPRQRIDEVLEIVGLTSRARDKVKAYSHGMRQRLGIAQALLPRPDLVVLDEPSTGLDPQGMRDVRELIRDLAARERVTVFLSSHLLHEVEQVCNRVTVINRGKLVSVGDVDTLVRQGSSTVRVVTSDPERAAILLQRQGWIGQVQPDGDALRVSVKPESVPELNALLVQAGPRVSELIPIRASLEEIFFQLTGEDNRA